MNVDCVTKDMLPFSFCENPTMKKFMLCLEPNYQPPCHRTVRNHLTRRYNEREVSLAEKIQVKEIAVKDSCISSQKFGYFSSWTIMDQLKTGGWRSGTSIARTAVDGRHAGEMIAAICGTVLTEWPVTILLCARHRGTLHLEWLKTWSMI